MIYLTQLIFLVKGEETVFDQFESVAIPIISKYNGKLLLRIRPTSSEVLEMNMDESPYEIHFIQFERDVDFENFKMDKERQQFLHLKEASIRSSFLVKGIKV